ncbi:hypothetical protein CCR81_01425 [Halorhodospira halophila]|nr:hypothetical protein [Halorhodospira halophila]
MEDQPGVERFPVAGRLMQEASYTLETLDQKRSSDGQSLRRELVNFVHARVLGLPCEPPDRGSAHHRPLLERFSYEAHDTRRFDNALARLILSVKAISEGGYDRSWAGKTFRQQCRFFFQAMMEIFVPNARFVLFDSHVRAHSPHLLALVPEAKMLVAWRDPRDVYANRLLLGKHSGDVEAFVSELEQNWAFFEKRRDERRVRLVSFERFVTRSEERKRVLEWLGCADAPDVDQPGERFNPEQSARNIGVYRDLESSEQIDFIARRLEGWLYGGH